MKKSLFITTILLTTVICSRSYAQCNGGGIWNGGTPVAGTLLAQGTIQGGINVTARSSGSFASGRPMYNRVNNTYNGFSYRSLTVIRGGANAFQSASTYFKLSTALSSTYIHFRVSDVRGDGFNAEPQRIRGYLNGVEVSATFEDAWNGAYVTAGNVINGASTTTSTIQSGIRIFFTGPVDSVVLTKTNGGDYVVFDLYSRCDIILPFQLSEFSAIIKQSTVLLNWKTSEAWNFETFDVERSPDAITWEKIGTRNIRETYNSTDSYQYIDHSPLYGRNFYRLRSMDTDGKTTFSSVVSVSNYVGEAQNGFRFSQNPVQNEFSLYFTREVPSLVQCFSSDGKILFQASPSGPALRINSSAWQNGLFFIRLLYPAGQQITTRILKQ